MSGPFVTVVVIAYNDAANLPTAVRSVTRQTLRDLDIVIVDDASTDGTGAVADELARSDSRIRVVHLPTNSGGCSRPRNTGIEQSRGAYVMFLDSDDVLDRRACARLRDAAERTGADIAAGRAARYHVTRKRMAGWYDRLYRHAAVLDGILDRPDQLYDTICTNKLYRLDFVRQQGLRFPEGLHYEDLLFTTEAYCTAERIAIVPHLVYVWNVVEETGAASISNRRLDLANWRDRIEVHRRIDAYLDGHHVGQQLRTAKDVKFLNHDMRLFLRDLPQYDRYVRIELFALVRDYVRGIDLDACAADARLVTRLAAQLTAAGDLPAVLAVSELHDTGQLDAGLVRGDLDLTELGLADAPLDRLPLTDIAESVEQRGAVLRITGVIPDLLGRLAAAPAAPTVRPAVVSKGARWRLDLPAGEATLRGEALQYAVELDLARVAERITLRDRLLRIVVTVEAGGERRDTGIVLRGGLRDVPAGIRAPVTSRYAPLVGSELVGTLVDGTLGLTLTDRHPALQRAVETARRVRQSRFARR
ncbi:MAG: glycosyltransferase family 2 protein [Frankiaceae bacterium]